MSEHTDIDNTLRMIRGLFRIHGIASAVRYCDQLTESIRRLEKANVDLADEVERLVKINSDKTDRMHLLSSGIRAVGDLISESRGVDGLHLNGDVVTWDELLAGGECEEWLKSFSKAAEAAREGG